MKEMVLVTPFVGVWIETLVWNFVKLIDRSHPSWVCGLKHYQKVNQAADATSHPSWVCGLKLTSIQ